MKTIHTLALSALAVAGLFSTAAESATPEFSQVVPRSSVELCVAQIRDRGNYENAGRVLHNVETRERRVSGHIMTIATFVYATDGEHVVREYATKCDVTKSSKIRLFKMRQTNDTA